VSADEGEGETTEYVLHVTLRTFSADAGVRPGVIASAIFRTLVATSCTSEDVAAFLEDARSTLRADKIGLVASSVASLAVRSVSSFDGP